MKHIKLTIRNLKNGEYNCRLLSVEGSSVFGQTVNMVVALLLVLVCQIFVGSGAFVPPSKNIFPGLLASPDSPSAHVPEISALSFDITTANAKRNEFGMGTLMFSESSLSKSESHCQSLCMKKSCVVAMYCPPDTTSSTQNCNPEAGELCPSSVATRSGNCYIFAKSNINVYLPLSFEDSSCKYGTYNSECRNAPSIPNTSRSVAMKEDGSVEHTYTCNLGYTSDVENGPNQVTVSCSKDGIWSSDTINCIEVPMVDIAEQIKNLQIPNVDRKANIAPGTNEEVKSNNGPSLTPGNKPPFLN